MKPDKTSVYDLFYNQRRLRCRCTSVRTCGSLEAQWQPLWQDIEDKAQAVLQRQTDVPHFFGAIVTGQRPVFGNRISSWDIIDGQQRLTTLQVVLKAFKDVMNAHAGKESKYDFDLKRITVNEGLMEAPDEQFKVWPTNSDRAVFRAVMTAGAIDKVIVSSFRRSEAESEGPLRNWRKLTSSSTSHGAVLAGAETMHGDARVEK